MYCIPAIVQLIPVSIFPMKICELPPLGIEIGTTPKEITLSIGFAKIFFSVFMSKVLLHIYEAKEFNSELDGEYIFTKPKFETSGNLIIGSRGIGSE